jgi:hypothetical protein
MVKVWADGSVADMLAFALDSATAEQLQVA